MLGFLTKIQ